MEVGHAKYMDHVLSGTGTASAQDGDTESLNYEGHTFLPREATVGPEKHDGHNRTTPDTQVHIENEQRRVPRANGVAGGSQRGSQVVEHDDVTTDDTRQLIGQDSSLKRTSKASRLSREERSSKRTSEILVGSAAAATMAAVGTTVVSVVATRKGSDDSGRQELLQNEHDRSYEDTQDARYSRSLVEEGHSGIHDATDSRSLEDEEHSRIHDGSFQDQTHDVTDSYDNENTDTHTSGHFDDDAFERPGSEGLPVGEEGDYNEVRSSVAAGSINEAFEPQDDGSHSVSMSESNRDSQVLRGLGSVNEEEPATYTDHSREYDESSVHEEREAARHDDTEYTDKSSVDAGDVAMAAGGVAVLGASAASMTRRESDGSQPSSVRRSVYSEQESPAGELDTFETAASRGSYVDEDTRAPNFDPGHAGEEEEDIDDVYVMAAAPPGAPTDRHSYLDVRPSPTGSLKDVHDRGSLAHESCAVEEVEYQRDSIIDNQNDEEDRLSVEHTHESQQNYNKEEASRISQQDFAQPNSNGHPEAAEHIESQSNIEMEDLEPETVGKPATLEEETTERADLAETFRSDLEDQDDVATYPMAIPVGGLKGHKIRKGKKKGRGTLDVFKQSSDVDSSQETDKEASMKSGAITEEATDLKSSDSKKSKRSSKEASKKEKKLSKRERSKKKSESEDLSKSSKKEKKRSWFGFRKTKRDSKRESIEDKENLDMIIPSVVATAGGTAIVGSVMASQKEGYSDNIHVDEKSQGEGQLGTMRDAEDDLPGHIENKHLLTERSEEEDSLLLADSPRPGARSSPLMYEASGEEDTEQEENLAVAVVTSEKVNDMPKEDEGYQTYEHDGDSSSRGQTEARDMEGPDSSNDHLSESVEDNIIVHQVEDSLGHAPYREEGAGAEEESEEPSHFHNDEYEREQYHDTLSPAVPEEDMVEHGDGIGRGSRVGDDAFYQQDVDQNSRLRDSYPTEDVGRRSIVEDSYPTADVGRGSIVEDSYPTEDVGRGSIVEDSYPTDAGRGSIVEDSYPTADVGRGSIVEDSYPTEDVGRGSIVEDSYPTDVGRGSMVEDDVRDLHGEDLHDASKYEKNWSAPGPGQFQAMATAGLMSSALFASRSREEGEHKEDSVSKSILADIRGQTGKRELRSNDVDPDIQDKASDATLFDELHTVISAKRVEDGQKLFETLDETTSQVQSKANEHLEEQYDISTFNVKARASLFEGLAKKTQEEQAVRAEDVDKPPPGVAKIALQRYQESLKMDEEKVVKSQHETPGAVGRLSDIRGSYQGSDHEQEDSVASSTYRADDESAMRGSPLPENTDASSVPDYDEVGSHVTGEPEDGGQAPADEVTSEAGHPEDRSDRAGESETDDHEGREGPDTGVEDVNEAEAEVTAHEGARQVHFSPDVSDDDDLGEDPDQRPSESHYPVDHSGPQANDPSAFQDRHQRQHEEPELNDSLDRSKDDSEYGEHHEERVL